MSSNSQFIGELRTSRFKYFDVKTNKLAFKSRPVLIVGCEKEVGPCDFTVLPVSTISNPANIIPDFDIFISMQEFPTLNLSRDSYCRTSKVSTVHSKDVGTKKIATLKDIYPELYHEIQTKFNLFSNSLF
ncbi:type II toxin-antitoxin system PemK/MazF family toxin [Enterococcus hermanniensis]|uniref:type II toxin-antitoxin system PemK/MazF family toxin n=1 Tax=Enterococcus hermanniensis TaxID=249189 RepID=UPI0009004D72|nr:type II toxin-antitoxin system PemK/MazF family toxin [Enterococcus hermanniensis]